VHRGIYDLSEKASQAYEQARKKVGRFINANSWREIVFTRNATESLNLLSWTWGLDNLKQGDVILISEMEHHANLIPWQQVAKRTGAILKYFPITPRGEICLSAYKQLLTPKVKLVAFTLMSNVLGTIPPAKEMIEQAHAVGAIVVGDGAQSVPHLPTDVQDLGLDFLVFSGHKMLGPTGIGVLWGKKSLLENMSPFMTGGEMIKRVSYQVSDWHEVPWKFEAGTPAIAQSIGLGYAVDYLNKIGMENVRQHEKELVTYALVTLGQVEGLRIIGSIDPDIRGGAVTFTFEDIHPHDLATLLNYENVAVRAGHHCAQPLHNKLGLTATTRASFYIYNQPSDVDHLVEALEKARKVFDT